MKSRLGYGLVLGFLGVFLLGFVQNVKAQGFCEKIVFVGPEGSLPGLPLDAGVGVTYSWNVVNQGSCDISGYRLQFQSAELNGSLYTGSDFGGNNHPPFSIAVGGATTIQARFSMPVAITAPVTDPVPVTDPDPGTTPGIDPGTDPAAPTDPTASQLKVYFDIINADGEILPPLPGGRLYAEFGGAGMLGSGPLAEACMGVVAPTVSNARISQLGNGKAIVSATITNNVTSTVNIEGVQPGVSAVTDSTGSNTAGTPAGSVVTATVFVNGASFAMTSIGGNFYSVVAENSTVGLDQYQIMVSNGCASTTTGFNADGSQSEMLGSQLFCGDISGSAGDPINTATGNFTHTFSDASVVGVGDTSLSLERTYNSNAALWNPATVVEYAGTGDEDEGEVVEGPPQYFGLGWSTPFDAYLLRLDQAPVFNGLQIRDVQLFRFSWLSVHRTVRVHVRGAG